MPEPERRGERYGQRPYESYRSQTPSSYRERPRPDYGYQNQKHTDGNGNEDIPPTLMGQFKMWKLDLKRLNKAIEQAFPETPDDIAYKLVKITPRAIAVCYILLLSGIAASRLNILWTEGSLWGIASLSTVMIGVFLWVWSSNVIKLPNISDKARAELRKAMRIQATTFIAAVLTIIYFVGMAFHFW